jgi:acetate kinase
LRFSGEPICRRDDRRHDLYRRRLPYPRPRVLPPNERSICRAARRRDQRRFVVPQFSFYEGERRLLTGQVDGIGAHPSASAAGPDGAKVAPPDLGTKPPTTPSEVLPAVLPWARERLGDSRLAAVGHRVVHGGLRYSRPARVTPELLVELEALVPLAPLHEPYNLAPIKMAMNLNPGLPQISCFDTAFHRTAPEVDQAFALPYSFFEEGIRRYGFHGLSYEYIASVLPERAPKIANGRVVMAHLGNGCSACAMRNRVSVATTMGFTALDGLPMGTRCGELDAGVVLYLIQQRGMSPDQLVDLLYRRSGMLGLSGISSNFRELFGQRQSACSLCVGGVLRPRCPPHCIARGGTRRPRWNCVHRRCRRECSPGAKRDLPGL